MTHSQFINQVYDSAIPFNDPDFLASGGEAANPLIDRFSALRHIRRELRSRSLRLADVAHNEGWRVIEAHSSLGGPHILVPSFSSSGLRALKIYPINKSVRRIFTVGTRQRAYSDHAVHTLYSEELPGPDDVPSPSGDGLFDYRTIWVCRDPVDVLVLHSIGINAVALATPRASLGQPAYLDQLSGIGLLIPRLQPLGRIIISDKVRSNGETWGPVLSRHFSEIIELPTGMGPYADLTGIGLIEWVENAIEKNEDVKYKLDDYVSTFGRHFKRPDESSIVPEWSGRAFGEIETETAWDTPYERKPLALIPVSELAAMSDPVPWIAEPFVASRAITDLHGLPKAGKTTFLLALAAAIAQGTDFLGHRCEKTPVIYVSEQTAGILNGSVEDALALVPDLHVTTVEATFGRQLGEIVPFLLGECKRLGARIVVIDTLASIAGLGGDADNQAGVARDIYRVLRGFSVAGVAVIVVRHSRKARGSITQTAMGSVAFSGEADQLIRVSAPNEHSDLRRIEIVGRLSGLSSLTVRFRDHRWVLVEKAETEAAGVRQDRTETPKGLEAVWRVLEHAGTQGATPDEAAVLAEDVGGFGRALAASTVLNYLRGFVRAGAAIQEPGVNADKARYWVKPDAGPDPDHPGRSVTALTLIHSSSPP